MVGPGSLFRRECLIELLLWVDRLASAGLISPMKRCRTPKVKMERGRIAATRGLNSKPGHGIDGVSLPRLLRLPQAVDHLIEFVPDRAQIIRRGWIVGFPTA